MEDCAVTRMLAKRGLCSFGALPLQPLRPALSQDSMRCQKRVIFRYICICIIHNVYIIYVYIVVDDFDVGFAGEVGVGDAGVVYADVEVVRTRREDAWPSA